MLVQAWFVDLGEFPSGSLRVNEVSLWPGPLESGGKCQQAGQVDLRVTRVVLHYNVQAQIVMNTARTFQRNTKHDFPTEHEGKREIGSMVRLLWSCLSQQRHVTF